MAAARGGTSRPVPTPLGDARLFVHAAAEPVATLVLGHGAGGGTNSRDLQALARALPAAGITVVLLDQPWVVAGRRVAPPPPVLDRAWLAAVPAVEAAGPLVLGGRSAGARVACRTAGALGAAGVLALAFPLHPPGRPERSRVAELLSAGVDVLVVQGERDAFGRPEEFPAETRIRVVPGADHGLRVTGGTPAQQHVLADVCASVTAWVRAVVSAGGEPGPGGEPGTGGRQEPGGNGRRS